MSEEVDVPPVEDAAAAPPQDLITRDDKGRFVKGMSGNPAGKQKGRKNRIKELQTAHELALREYISDPDRQQLVLKSLDNLFRIAGGGTDDKPVEDNHAVSAGKLLLDKLMPKAAAGEAQKGSAPSAIQVTIENNTGQTGTLSEGAVTIEMRDPDDDD